MPEGGSKFLEFSLPPVAPLAVPLCRKASADNVPTVSMVPTPDVHKDPIETEPVWG